MPPAVLSSILNYPSTPDHHISSLPNFHSIRSAPVSSLFFLSVSSEKLKLHDRPRGQLNPPELRQPSSSNHESPSLSPHVSYYYDCVLCLGAQKYSKNGMGIPQFFKCHTYLPTIFLLVHPSLQKKKVS
uniref:Uncharacterized protein n=1 Tax=Cannabis sativa TaxID=3483 RepID=A0A803R405_CANSA